LCFFNQGTILNLLIDVFGLLTMAPGWLKLPKIFMNKSQADIRPCSWASAGWSCSCQANAKARLSCVQSVMK
jgi:hypothetical protein